MSTFRWDRLNGVFNIRVMGLIWVGHGCLKQIGETPEKHGCYHFISFSFFSFRNVQGIIPFQTNHLRTYLKTTAKHVGTVGRLPIIEVRDSLSPP